MVYVETPTNPLMEVSDIAALAEIAHGAGALLAVDNTFLSPYFQRPLALGADIVVHSTTKFLNGHSDSVGGVLITSREEDAEWFRFVSKSAGAILSPMDSFLVMRGIKTLAVRMERHEANARAVAAMLDQHPKVRTVLYPGLESHPGHGVQKAQATGFGALITFDVGGYEAAKRLLDRLEVLSLAESLGGVETLISHPASMTHASVPAAIRRELGLTDGMVRVSVGIEDVEDLLEDLGRGSTRSSRIPEGFRSRTAEGEPLEARHHALQSSSSTRSPAPVGVREGLVVLLVREGALLSTQAAIQSRKVCSPRPTSKVRISGTS